MRTIILLIGVICLCIAGVQAQSDVCPTTDADLVTAAMDACGEMGSDEICYGAGIIDALVNCDDAPDFAATGDRIPATAICALRLRRDENGQASVAALNIRDAASSTDISMIVMGDVEMQNAGSSTSELQVWTIRDAAIHRGPGSQYEVIATIPEGEVTYANACNCTGNWLRIMLEDGQIGWILSRDVTVIGDAAGLPVASSDTPVYAAMQAVMLQTGIAGQDCGDGLTDGLLIQVPAAAEPVPLQINGAQIMMAATIFVQAQRDAATQIYVLDGTAAITANNQTLIVPAGIRYTLLRTAAGSPTGDFVVEPFPQDIVDLLPLAMLPEAVDPVVAFNNRIPQIIGVEECAVISGHAESMCPVYFINMDGDAISRMDVEFVYAPLGEWEGSVRENPPLLQGTTTSGVLGWGVSCSLGASENFIGPVRWSITITDDEGHTSPAFEAITTCVEG